MFSKETRVAFTFGLVTILLLFGSVAFWLYSVYQEKRAQITTERSYIFERSFNVIEDSLINVIIKDGFTGHDSQEGSFQMRIESDGEIEQIKFETGTEFLTNQSDSVVRNISITVNSGDTTRLSQSLRMLQALEPKWSSKPISDTTLIYLVEKEFQSALQIKGIPATKVLKTGSTLVKNHPEIPTGFILNKMIPEIMFSLLLLSCAGLTFFFVGKTLKKQKVLNGMKDDLISNISHELKTPISTVKVALEAISGFESSNEDKRDEYLDISHHELNRISLLVDKVLNINQFQSSSDQIAKQEIDLLKIVEVTMASFNVLISQRGGKIDLIQEGSNFNILGDALHLSNVIYNLIDNGIKYSSGHPEITIKLLAEKSNVLLSITDQGIGIPDVYKEQVFERFFRISSDKHTHNVKGHGLGLSYSSALIKQHGGQITVSDNPKGGSIFTVQLNRKA